MHAGAVQVYGAFVRRNKLLSPVARDRIVDVGDPPQNPNDDEKDEDENEEKKSVALALAGEIPFARGERFGGAHGRGVILHSPDRRFVGFDGAARSVQFIGDPLSLLGKDALLFFQLTPPRFKRVRVLAFPRHAGEGIRNYWRRAIGVNRRAFYP